MSTIFKVCECIQLSPFHINVMFVITQPFWFLHTDLICQNVNIFPLGNTYLQIGKPCFISKRKMWIYKAKPVKNYIMLIFLCQM